MPREGFVAISGDRLVVDGKPILLKGRSLVHPWPEIFKLTDRSWSRRME